MKHQIAARLVNLGLTDIAVEFVACQAVTAGLSSRNYQKLIGLLKPLGRKQLMEVIDEDMVHAIDDGDVDKLAEKLSTRYRDMAPNPIPPMQPVQTNVKVEPAQLEKPDAPKISPGLAAASMKGQIDTTKIRAPKLSPLSLSDFDSNPATNESMPRSVDDGEQVSIINNIKKMMDDGLSEDGILQQLESTYKLPQDLAADLLNVAKVYAEKK